MARATSCRSLVVAALAAARVRNAVGLVGHEGRRHEQPGGVVGLGSIEDLGRRRVVAADQPAEQDLDVGGHGLTVLAGADDPLTAT